MKQVYNKKNIKFLNIKNFLKLFILFFFLFSLLFFIYNELQHKERFYKIINLFSNKFEYNLEIFEINNLNRADKTKISEIINEYLGQSIFLLPLKKISSNIKDVTWVKNINLKTNLKNRINIEITEYKPIGIYSFNNSFFYFSEDGKIVDQLNRKNNENLIIFYGNNSLKKANNFLKKIKKIEKINLIKIKEAYLINDRRWDIKLGNNLLLYLSEKNIETSINNYIKLKDKLKDSEIISIKSIDLRNEKKAIIGLEIYD